jgi:hypothetical protein
MERKLFCEISPFTYRLSMEKEIEALSIFLQSHYKNELSK